MYLILLKNIKIFFYLFIFFFFGASGHVRPVRVRCNLGKKKFSESQRFSSENAEFDFSGHVRVVRVR